MNKVAVVAASFSAAVAALTVPDHSPGVGVVVVVALATVAILTSAERPAGPWFWIFGVLCWAAVLTSVFVAAEWVVGPNLLGAAALGALALSAARTPRELVGAVLVPARLPSGLGIFIRRFRARAETLSPGWVKAIPTALVSVLLLGVFGALFISADKAFAAMAQRAVIPDWDVSLVPIRIVVGVGALGVIGAISQTRVLAGRFTALDPFAASTKKTTWNGWMVPLVLLNLLFSLFVAVQFAVLFGGNTHVLRTAGLTFAEYARQGFFQLLAVGGLTLTVVGVAMLTVKPASDRERLLLRVLLGGLCLLSLVVLASGLKRLGLYEQSFGYTIDRFIAHSLMLWIGGLFVLVIALGIARREQLLPRVAVVLTAIVAISISYANPERIVARHNVARYEATGKIDTRYLSTLGEDIVPELAPLPVGLQACALAPIAERATFDDSWAAFNLARNHAQKLLDQYRMEVTTC